jgi:antirestriction protein ArdC
MKKDIYTEVTNKIIAALEKNIAPWVQPWSSNNTSSLPRNAVSNQHYRGINIILLWDACMSKGYKSSGWMTYKQAEALGSNVKKGEKGTEIIFYKKLQVNETLTDIEEATEKQVTVTIPMLKSFSVFNSEQIENLPKTFTEAAQHETLSDIDNVIENTGAVIRHGGASAFFNPSQDYIAMPHQADFKSTPDYYATLLHELSHWTGHHSRLDRLASIKRFGDEAYAMEELIAELSAAFLCAELGVKGKLQHENYIAHWLKVLREDKKAIFTAAAKASNAAEYIINAA